MSTTKARRWQRLPLVSADVDPRPARAVAVEHAHKRRAALVIRRRRWRIAGSPASIAGLPPTSACVSVGPPLSASGANSGLIGEPPVPIWLPFVRCVMRRARIVADQVERLGATTAPEISSRVEAWPRLPATIVWSIVRLAE